MSWLDDSINKGKQLRLEDKYKTPKLTSVMEFSSPISTENEFYQLAKPISEELHKILEELRLAIKNELGLIYIVKGPEWGSSEIMSEDVVGLYLLEKEAHYGISTGISRRYLRWEFVPEHSEDSNFQDFFFVDVNVMKDHQVYVVIIGDSLGPKNHPEIVDSSGIKSYLGKWLSAFIANEGKRKNSK
jgi:hypothetical protein